MKKNKAYKYLALTIGWLIALAILTWFFSSRMPSAGSNGEIPGHSHFYIALTALISKTVFVGVMIFYILPQFSRKRSLPIFIFQSIACLAIFFASEQFIQAYFVQPYMNAHNHGLFRNNPFWMFNLFLFLFLLLVICSYYFTREWVRNEKQKRELTEAQLSAELKFLKAQINPHFLFNTLNNLFSIAQRNKDDETANGISKLAGLMRYMLYDSSVTKISLEKEVKNIEDYIALSKLRYANDEINASLEVRGNIGNAYIAPMILLPFVENAFKHGVTIEKTSAISITLEVTGEKIIFTCSNPVVELNSIKQDEYGGIGLENVKRRLSLLYTNKHSLAITEDTEKFSVRLELEK